MGGVSFEIISIPVISAFSFHGVPNVAAGKTCKLHLQIMNAKNNCSIKPKTLKP